MKPGTVQYIRRTNEIGKSIARTVITSAEGLCARPEYEKDRRKVEEHISNIMFEIRQELFMQDFCNYSDFD